MHFLIPRVEKRTWEEASLTQWDSMISEAWFFTPSFLLLLDLILHIRKTALYGESFPLSFCFGGWECLSAGIMYNDRQHI